MLFINCITIQRALHRLDIGYQAVEDFLSSLTIYLSLVCGHFLVGFISAISHHQSVGYVMISYIAGYKLYIYIERKCIAYQSSPFKIDADISQSAASRDTVITPSIEHDNGNPMAIGVVATITMSDL